MLLAEEHSTLCRSILIAERLELELFHAHWHRLMMTMLLLVEGVGGCKLLHSCGVGTGVAFACFCLTWMLLQILATLSSARLGYLGCRTFL